MSTSAVAAVDVASESFAAPTAPAVPVAPAAQSAGAGNPSLYVGDLHAEVTEAILFEKFNAVGPVATVRVCRDNVTRRSLGYAYVNFVSPDDAQLALNSLNFDNIKGSPIRIMASQRDPSIRRSNTGNIFIKNLHKDIDNVMLFDTFVQFGKVLSCKVKTDPVKGGSLGYGFVHYGSQEEANNAIAQVNGQVIMEQKLFVGPFVSQKERVDKADTSRFTNVFLKNVPPTFTDDQLYALGSPFGVITSHKAMPTLSPTATSTVAFIAFREPEHAQAAVTALMGKELSEGVKLYAARAQSKQERAVFLRGEAEKRRTGATAVKNANLFVKNLDVSTTDADLHALFAPHGTITSAAVMFDSKDPEHKYSKGFGFVCFTNNEEAVKAQVSLNKTNYKNKPLYVGFAQAKNERKQELIVTHQARSNQAMMYPGAGMGMAGGMFPFNFNPQFAQQFQQQQFAQFALQQQQQYAAQQQRGGPFPGYQQFPGAQRPRFPNNFPQNFNFPPGAFPPGAMQQGPRPTGNFRPPNQGQPQNPNQGQGPQQRGPQQQQNAPRGANGQQASVNRNRGPQPANAQFNQQARNVPQVASGSGGNAQEQFLQEGQGQFTLAELAQKPEAEQKQILGERLYPAISNIEGTAAAKITGMLLEMDVGEIFHLLEDNNALTIKVQEAVEVLAAHQKATDGQAQA